MWGNGRPGLETACFKKDWYFEISLHLLVALLLGTRNHLKLCPYDRNLWLYGTYGKEMWKFSNFDFSPEKGASPGFMKTAINLPEWLLPKPAALWWIHERGSGAVYDLLVVSQLHRSPLSIRNQIPFMLAQRGLVIPLVVISLGCKYRMV